MSNNFSFTLTLHNTYCQKCFPVHPKLNILYLLTVMLFVWNFFPIFLVYLVNIKISYYSSKMHGSSFVFCMHRSLQHLSTSAYSGSQYTSLPQLVHKLYYFGDYTVSQKNIPDIFDCNLKTNYQISIIFGTNIPDTTCHQIIIQFLTSPNVC